MDHYRHRRLRPAVEVDRLSREHPVGLALIAARTPGVPDDPASVPAQMDLGQRGRAGRHGPRGADSPDGGRSEALAQARVPAPSLRGVVPVRDAEYLLSLVRGDEVLLTGRMPRVDGES